MWRICPSFLSRHNIPRSSQFSRHNVPCSSQISRHHVPLFEVMGYIGYKSYCSAFQQFARIGLHEQCIFIRPTMLWLLFIVIQQLMLRLSQQICYAWVMFGKGKVVEFWAFSLRLCSIAFMQVSHLISAYQNLIELLNSSLSATRPRDDELKCPYRQRFYFLI